MVVAVFRESTEAIADKKESRIQYSEACFAFGSARYKKYERWCRQRF
jgi:hypothetical protein